MPPAAQVLEVWGDFACFSRPELKVERFSYPVITPSAARGIFDAIYAKPVEFRWAITAVEVLRPPAFIALRRNEVKEKVNVNSVFDWMSGKRPPEPLWADADRELAGTDEKGAPSARPSPSRTCATACTPKSAPGPVSNGNRPPSKASPAPRRAGKMFLSALPRNAGVPGLLQLAAPDDPSAPCPRSTRTSG